MHAKVNPTRQMARLFSVLAYDEADHLFLIETRTVGFGFVLKPLHGVDQGTFDRLNVFFNQEWPVNTLIQILLFTSPDLENWLEIHRRRTEVSRDRLEGALADQARTFLRQSTHSPIQSADAVRVRRSELLVLIQLPLAAPLPDEGDLARARALRKSARQAMKTVGLAPVDLTAAGYIRQMEVLINWHPEAGWRQTLRSRWDPDLPIREQIADFDQALEVDAQGLRLGNRRVKTLSVKRYPEQFHFGAARSYLGDILSGSRGLRENVLITLSLHYPDVESTKARLETQRQWVTHQAHGPMLKFLPQLAQRKQGFDVLFDAFQDGDRPVRASLTLVLFVDPKSEEQAVSNARSYFRELGFQLFEDRFISLPVFLNALPFGADRAFIRDSYRYRTFGTRHVLPLLPILSDWTGTGTPTLNLISRSGELMGLSLFDSGSNYNATIAAQSGSGKSFLTNEIIVSTLAEGGRVWVIDVGRSYQNLAETLRGEFMAFTPDSGISLNPFDLIHDWNEEADAVAGIVTAMMAPNDRLSDFQSAALKRVLKDLYEAHANTMTVDDVAIALHAQGDSRIRDMGEQLFPFTERGEYGRYFKGRNTVAFSGQLIVLELEELKGRKHLQQVVLLQLIFQIQQAMYLGDRGRRKLVIIDESWDLLTMGDAACFIEHGYRRFRKYGGSAITLTQSVNDLYRTPTGRAIAENSAHMFLLGQKPEAIEALRMEKRLPLSDGGYTLLKTVHTVPGAYSELFYLGESGPGIGRLIVDPYKQVLYSTRPDDIAAIKASRQSGLSLDASIKARIKALAGERP